MTETRTPRRRPASLIALLLATTALPAAVLPQIAHAQTARSIGIPAQPLDDALRTLMAATGVDVTWGSRLSQGRTSSAVSGEMSPAAALSRILAGTGLTWRQTGPRSFIIEAAPAAEADVIQLSPLRIEGGTIVGAGAGRDRPGWDGSAATVYDTPGSVGVISRETVGRFPGLSTSDILRGTPGVLTGESRTSGGLDANIRGLQGQGRVVVTVDGTLNSTSVYRGYQGVGNRTFIDKDFLGGVSIEKGPSTGPGVGGIGGTVNVATITVDDVLPDGESFGLRLKASLNGNTAPTTDAAFRQSQLFDNNGVVGNLDRPGFLDLTGGSVSTVFAARSDRLDILAAVSHRRSGDYHAGTRGDAAPDATVPDPYCVENPDDGVCPQLTRWYTPGLTRFVGGERVLNTWQDTRSALVKADLRLGDHHALQFAWSKYLSHFGENYPASVYRNTDTVYQMPASRTDLDRYSLRYAWTPDSDLFALKANLWATDMVELSQALGGGGQPKFVEMRGADLSNLTRFDTPRGAVVAEYGVSWLTEETGPERGVWVSIPSRQGSREETSVFARASWAPSGRLRLDGSLRHAWSEVEDTLAPPIITRDYDGGGFSFGGSYDLPGGVQLFASYKAALRLPSLLEASRGFMLASDPGLEPERTRNWEVGANFQGEGLFHREDSLGAKLVWFDNDIENYISRKYDTSTFSMLIFNIDRAAFAGAELSATYRRGGFQADASATWYADVRFCRRGETCLESSLAADYATNQVPPEFAASLSLTQALFNERLVLGGRVSHIGERAVPAERTGSGASPFIAAIPWEPYVVADAFLGYQLTPSVRLEAAVENVGDEHYVEPMSLGLVPAPGRTFRMGLTTLLAGAPSGGGAFRAPGRDRADGAYDWSGVHLGVHAGASHGPARAEDFRFSVDGAVYDNQAFALGDSEGGVAGLQAGYTQQLNDLVFVGVEATHDRADLEAEVSPYFGARIRVKTDALTTARLRAGVTRGRWMAYGAGGWAGGEVDFLHLRDGRTWRDEGRASGYVAAAGAEYALTRSASLRLEYAYTDMKSDDALGGDVVDADLGMTFGVAARPRLQADQLTFGVNFRF